MLLLVVAMTVAVGVVLYAMAQCAPLDELGPEIAHALDARPPPYHVECWWAWDEAHTKWCEGDFDTYAQAVPHLQNWSTHDSECVISRIVSYRTTAPGRFVPFRPFTEADLVEWWAHGRVDVRIAPPSRDCGGRARPCR